jgi:type IV secretion system protein VirB9
MIRYFVLSAMLVFSAASIAVEKPPVKEVLTSRRIEYVDFQDGRVYPLLGVKNHPLVIEFPDDQTILEVAGGGIGGWDVQRKGSRLFVRALPEAKLSTMLVVTDAHSYVFDLVPASPSPENLRIRRSRFVFNAPAKVDETTPLAVEKPAEKLVENTPLVSPVLQASKTPEAVVDETMPLAVEKPTEKLVENTPSVSPALQVSKAPEALKAETPMMKPALNRNYTMQIVKEEVIIRPREVFDDGVFTWFLFPKSQSVPVLYKSVPGTKEEAVINFHMEGEYLVAHATSALWNLRLGGSLVGVYNESFDPTGLSGKSR